MATRTNMILPALKTQQQKEESSSKEETRPLMNIHSSLVSEMRDKQYRDAFVASQIRIGIPMQIRALRKSRDLSQPEFAELAGMAQPRISEIEKPGERRLNIETLLRLASALDVGLQVRFVPFDRLIYDDEHLDLDNFSIKTFDELVKEAEEQQQRKESQRNKVIVLKAAKMRREAESNRSTQSTQHKWTMISGRSLVPTQAGDSQPEGSQLDLDFDDETQATSPFDLLSGGGGSETRSRAAS